MTQKIEEKIKLRISNLERKMELIRRQFQMFFDLIPEESIEDYENPEEIKKAYLRARKEFSQK